MPNDTIHPSPFFTIIWGFDLTYNGKPLSAGDVIEARDTRGNLCGKGTVVLGTYPGFEGRPLIQYTPIYGYDSFTPTIPGPIDGDMITFDVTTGGKKITNVRSYPNDVIFGKDPTQKQFGGLIEVKRFVKGGDVNADGVVDLADLTALVKHLMNGKVPGGYFSVDAADINHDITLNLKDLVALLANETE